MVLMILLVISEVLFSSADIQLYYLEDLCGKTQDMSTVHSALVETSLGLTYSNNVQCTVTFRGPDNKQFYMQLRRFATEQSGSECYDYLSIYDGEDVSSPVIVDKLCGEVEGQPEYLVSSNYVTLRFVSDESAGDRGFSIFLMAHTRGSCQANEVLCESQQICIDEEDSLCDDFDHCKDKSDEPSSCIDDGDSTDGLNGTPIELAIGLAIVGVVILILIAVVGRHCYNKYKWNQYMKNLYGKMKLGQTKMAPSYPLTHAYQNDEYVNITRANRDAAMVQLDEVIHSSPNVRKTSCKENIVTPLEDTKPVQQNENQQASQNSQLDDDTMEPSMSSSIDEDIEKDEGVIVGPDQLGDHYEGYSNPAISTSSDKVTEL